MPPRAADIHKSQRTIYAPHPVTKQFLTNQAADLPDDLPRERRSTDDQLSRLRKAIRATEDYKTHLITRGLAQL